MEISVSNRGKTKMGGGRLGCGVQPVGGAEKLANGGR